MKKRYSIPKEQCTCGISELYDNVAKIMGVSDLSKVVYDCRKLSITKKVLDCLYKFYHSENQLLNTLFSLCELADFHIEGRVVLKDKRTGKVWR